MSLALMRWTVRYAPEPYGSVGIPPSETKRRRFHSGQRADPFALRRAAISARLHGWEMKQTAA